MTQQQALGIISRNKKDLVLEQINLDKQLVIVHDKQFDLSIKSALEVFKQQVNKAQSVYGFVVEGPNSIQALSEIMEQYDHSLFVHASQDLENAQCELNWFNKVLLNAGANQSSSKKHQPIGKKPLSVSGTRLRKTPSGLRSTNAQQQQQVANKSSRHSLSSSSSFSSSNTTKTPKTAIKKKNTTAITTTTTTITMATARSKIPSSKLLTDTNKKSSLVSSTRPTKRTTSAGVTSSANFNLTDNHATVRPSPTTSRRGASTTATKKALSSTAKGGVSKNTPPVSVLTGRTRKPSRLTATPAEKRPIASKRTVATKPLTKEEVSKRKEQVAVQPKVKEEVEEIEEKETEPEIKEHEAEPAVEELSAPEQLEKIKEAEEDEELKLAEEKVEVKVEETVEQIEENHQEKQLENEQKHPIIQQEEPKPISHLSTSSSVATTDEHDAEVAATTNKAKSQQQYPTYIQSGRSSFSPNSVASLPRPETPEVDQLRLRFESMIQTAAPATEMIRRRSSPKITPEFANRIKDMKPRGPVGNRVKSMVELFMDENLNKWEF